ncbi:YdeI family stress tolerance OB fold protein [Raoultella terrigena]|uniref:YdeI family stress tolerance OB fold protein n=1 Tax=Raoultella terrigena TaxID=577 RepID=UPI000E058DB0|nr:YdeI family stress tolerance OB fold protein [Raoultella terrigena]SUQ57851.1 Uncharacterized conserved protein [Raoultella terrigena]VTM12676.1 Uncharacterized conserved protein [Raoultella terrigena]
MKIIPILIISLLATLNAHADEKGGFNGNAAPPPPHKLDDGYRGMEDARIMTVEHAKTMHDGATISLRGNLIERQGDDRYILRDKTGEITAIIPAAVFSDQEVKPDHLVSINGSLDTKMTPPVVRVDRLQKQAPE